MSLHSEMVCLLAYGFGLFPLSSSVPKEGKLKHLSKAETGNKGTVSSLDDLQSSGAGVGREAGDEGP